MSVALDSMFLAHCNMRIHIANLHPHTHDTYTGAFRGVTKRNNNLQAYIRTHTRPCACLLQAKKVAGEQMLTKQRRFGTSVGNPYLTLPTLTPFFSAPPYVTSGGEELSKGLVPEARGATAIANNAEICGTGRVEGHGGGSSVNLAGLHMVCK